MNSCLTLALLAGMAAAPSQEEAAAALKRAARYYRETLSTNGGYLWQYTADLQERWGEGKATPTQIWVQPPGTPSAGIAYLQAYVRTRDDYYLAAAREAANALVWGQLASGGWAYSIDFDPRAADKYFYRRHLEAGQAAGDKRTETTFDDDTSQSALRFLMLYDHVIRFSDEKVGRACRYALDHFMKAQYPSGGWPQRYSEPCRPEDWPVKPAEYPQSWPREWPNVAYKSYYTLNDKTIPDLIETMLLAHAVYGEQHLLDSALRGGDFLLLAQMPEPQPAWAQQYDQNMRPAWARKFEPPAIVTGESGAAIRSLMRLYVETGDHKYRKPIAKALDWMERSRLPDGRLARFYELKTNRPLYFNTRYELTYDDSDLPTHYAFKSSLNTGALRARLELLDSERDAEKRLSRSEKVARELGHRAPRPSGDTIRKIVDDLDAQGRWVDGGFINMEVFARNVELLSAYLTDSQP